MEETAVEEVMVLQGDHPETTFVTAERQVRHDLRLDLAEKERKYEDNHVAPMRKAEENVVWNGGPAQLLPADADARKKLRPGAAADAPAGQPVRRTRAGHVRYGRAVRAMGVSTEEMVLNTQQQQQGSVRGRSGSHASSAVSTPTNEYYKAPFGHNRYQLGTGTPPPPGPPQNQNNNGGSSSYQGFHPYRRPDRSNQRPRIDNASSPVSNTGSGNSVPFTPPYAHSDAAGSSSFVNTTSSQSQRSRTNSGTSANGSVRQSQHVPRLSQASSSPPVARGSSSSAPTSSVPTSSSNAPTLAARAARPSPLSQGSILLTAEQRKSRDDSDLAAMLSSTSIGGLDGSSPVAMPAAKNGLEGHLRRVFSSNAAPTLREEEEKRAKVNGEKKEKPKDGDTETEADGTSMATQKTKESPRIFISRFSFSTDSISLSSTVSSASLRIGKLGSMRRLARRSFAGITSLFKDKDKDKHLDGDEEGVETDKKGKKLKGKGKKAEASVSHATASEVDRSADPGMEGLSPAAKLARQHTLESNAEAAARATAQH